MWIQLSFCTSKIAQTDDRPNDTDEDDSYSYRVKPEQ